MLTLKLKKEKKTMLKKNSGKLTFLNKILTCFLSKCKESPGRNKTKRKEGSREVRQCPIWLLPFQWLQKALGMKEKGIPKHLIFPGWIKQNDSVYTRVAAGNIKEIGLDCFILMMAKEDL